MSVAAGIRYLGFISVSSALYIVVALLGTSLAITPGNVSPVYPAAGLAFGGYLVFGPRILPAIFIGGCLGNYLSISPLEVNLVALQACAVIGLGEVLSVLLAAKMLLRMCNPDQILESPRGVLFLFSISALWVLSPSFGVTALCLYGLLEWQAYSYAWLTWWLGGAIGLMLVAPLFLLFRGSRAFEFPGKRPVKLFTVVLAYSILIVGLNYSPLPVAFLLLPATMIMVLNFDALGAAMASTIAGVLVIGMVLIGGNLYQNFELNQRLLLLQLLVGVNAFTGFFLAAHVRTIKKLTESVSQARRESERDALTGLLNRRGFDYYSAQIIKQARQDDRGLALLMIDLDNFKHINDTFGHDAGDYLLSSFAAVLQNILRANDIAARIGGEEFVLLFDTTNIAELEKITNRLLQATRELRFMNAPPSFRLTVSGGFALTTEFSDLEQLLKAADNRLYIAKRSGKNQIVWP